MGDAGMDTRARDRRSVTLALVHVALAAGILLAFVLIHSGHG